MQPINARRVSSKQARNHFAVDALLWFFLALMLGSLVALAEFRAWLPCRILLWFDAPSASRTAIVSLIGLSLSQTIYVPLLFAAGLHSTSYYYTSRVISFGFWFWHGVDVWKYLLALREESWQRYLSVIPMIAVMLCMGWLMLRVHLIAAAGVAEKSAHYGKRPSAYFTDLLQYWGGTLMLQMAFYGLFIRFS